MTERIIGLANKLKNEFGTGDPREICRCMSISFLVTELPERLNGFYMETPSGRAVAVASRLDSVSARSCAAHELGHAVLHRGINTVFMSDNTSFVQGRFEREADLFAAALLLDDEKFSCCENIETLAAANALPLYAVERLWQMRLKKIS